MKRAPLDSLNSEIRSNNAKASEYASRMSTFVDETIAGFQSIPMRHGKINWSAIARSLGFDRERFHSNDELKQQMERLRLYAHEHPKTTPAIQLGEDEIKKLRDRIRDLEEKLAIKTAECDSFYEETVRRKRAEEWLLRTGRVVHFDDDLHSPGTK